jgi:hypothetical protein
VRYIPNLVRGEFVNVGVLLFNAGTGERRFRFIEDQPEFNRVRRLHPGRNESVLRQFRGHLEERFQTAETFDFLNHHSDWQQLVRKWDDSLSNVFELSSPTAVLATDLDAEMERLYDDHVALQSAPTRVGAPRSRSGVRAYCSQVFRQAGLWKYIEKSVHAEQWTLQGDPFRIDYSYRRNGTRGFVQALSISRSPLDFKQFAYTADWIRRKETLKTEFAVVTDVALVPGKNRDDFVSAALREAQIEPIPMEGFAVWVAKLKPLLLQ